MPSVSFNSNVVPGHRSFPHPCFEPNTLIPLGWKVFYTREAFAIYMIYLWCERDLKQTKNDDFGVWLSLCSRSVPIVSCWLASTQKETGGGPKRPQLCLLCQQCQNSLHCSFSVNTDVCEHGWHLSVSLCIPTKHIVINSVKSFALISMSAKCKQRAVMQFVWKCHYVGQNVST